MNTRKWLPILATFLLATTLVAERVCAQAGLRESLERLDINQNGQIDPNEITPLSRLYLERIAKTRGMSLDKPCPIDKLQEAARIYHAFQNGVAGKDIIPEKESSVMPFGPKPDEPLVPEFGLPEVKYAYTQADLTQAERTIQRSDRNEDGYLDRAEALRAKWTHRDPFEMDLDKDDRLSRLELAQRYARRRLLSEDAGELIRKAVRTGNGIRPSTPVQEERRDDSQWWRRGGTATWLTASILGRFDANRNGRLELEEAQELGVPTDQIDIDRDGELSRSELQTFVTALQEEAGGEIEGLPGWFYELDMDQDGQISMAEFATEWTDEKYQEFLRLDTNSDGLLTPAEMLQSKAMVGGSYFNRNAEILPPRRTIISEIEIDEDYFIADLNVQVSITHTHTSYLDAYLTGPDGQRVELFAEVGGHDDNFDETVFDDQARETITRARPPFKGTFTPSALSKRQPGLASFNGKNVRGVWQLIVRGTRSERFGMLHSWGLIIKPQEEILPGSTAELLSAIGESASDESVNGEPSPEGSDRDAEPVTETSSATNPDAASQLQAVGFRLVKSADKNGDGVLTIDEYPEKDRQHFATIDSNGDGVVDTAEVVAALSRLKGG